MTAIVTEGMVLKLCAKRKQWLYNLKKGNDVAYPPVCVPK
jgi:hypothetical protein